MITVCREFSGNDHESLEMHSARKGKKMKRRNAISILSKIPVWLVCYAHGCHVIINTLIIYDNHIPSVTPHLDTHSHNQT